MSQPLQVKDAHVRRMLEKLFEGDLHAKRVLSLANGTLGVIAGASLSVHAIGVGLAVAGGRATKHAIKQVDRLLSNRGIDLSQLFPAWVDHVVGPRKEIVAAIDWTEFDDDDQATIVIYLITSHGRATPLVWKSVLKSKMEGWRNAHEDRAIEQLLAVLPDDVKVTLLADRGFGDQKLYTLLEGGNVDFIIRFRGIISVTDDKGECRPADEWVPPNGRARMVSPARLTHDRTAVPAVVCVKAAGMRDPWCLATSRSDLPASQIVKLYAKRFTIEEAFRDAKDIRFGLGLSSTHVADPARRDRLLLLAALAIALLTLLGSAGESVGLDRTIRANTVKRRTHSLFRQGSTYYALLPNMKREHAELLGVVLILINPRPGRPSGAAAA
jgi:hypothetical protein